MDIALLENEPLARYTSWKIGGPARYFANGQTPAQLVSALQWAQEQAVPMFVLGGGSNVLVRDSGFAGLVVRYRASEMTIEQHGDTALVQIDAGAPMAGTVRKISRQGFGGLDWAEGLPGTIGGALFGNAGCYGGEIATTLTRAWLLIDGEIVEWPVEQFAYGYRTSVLKHRGQGSGVRGQGSDVRGQGSGVRGQEPGIQNPESRIQDSKSSIQHSATSPALQCRESPLTPIILRAEFALHRADTVALAQTIAERAEVRRSKTPQGQSCGSVFKNPPGDSAGRLIEAAGLKGAHIGGAEIAAKHANYIVNRGQATADDVLRLIDLAREQVLRECNVALELEVQIV